VVSLDFIMVFNDFDTSIDFLNDGWLTKRHNQLDSLV